MNARLMIALDGATELTDADRRRLLHPAVGGVILFARNYGDSAQLRRLTAAIRTAAARRIVIAVDQEGGRVQRFHGDGFTTLPAAADIAASDDADSRAFAVGVVLAAELLAHGVDLTFTPVLDIAHGRSGVISTRAFAAEPQRVAELGLRLAQGLAAGGMAACGKHFPGHGYAEADSHIALPVDDRALSALRACDLIPFARFAAAGVPLLMTAHVIYSAVDDNIATYSRIWLDEILRRELNFRGLVVSDDLTMAAATAGGNESIGERLQAAVAGGCDLLLVCQSAAVDDALAAATTLTGTAATTLTGTAATMLDGGNEADWRTLAIAGKQARVTIGDADYHAARAVITK